MPQLTQEQPSLLVPQWLSSSLSGMDPTLRAHQWGYQKGLCADSFRVSRIELSGVGVFVGSPAPAPTIVFKSCAGYSNPVGTCGDGISCAEAA